MKKIRVIQIGIGHDHALDVLDSMVAMKDVFEVVALGVPHWEVSTFSEKIKVCKEKIGVEITTVEAALNIKGVDAAVIETEEEHLCEFAVLAAEKNLHVHMDKPGCANLNEFESLVTILKDKNLVFSTGYMYRFNPEVQKVFKAVENGEFGEIFSIEAQMNCEHSVEKRRWLKKFPGGIMFFLGCHLIDIIYRIQGQPQVVLPLNSSVSPDIEGKDFGMAVLKYKNGCSFAKVCSAEAGGFSRRQIIISGTKKTIEIRPLEKWLYDKIFTFDDCETRKNMSTSVRRVDGGNWFGDAPFLECEPFNRYDSMMYRFAQRIDFDDEKVYTVDYELELYKLLMACVK